MKLLPLSSYLLLGAWLLCISCKDSGPDVSHAEAEKIFAYEVFPLLESKCMVCHGKDEKELEGDLDVRSLSGLLKGGKSGQAAIIPGYPEQSLLYLAASRVDEELAMPPKENDKLSDEQLHWLSLWIKGNAPWPDTTRRQELIAANDWDFGGSIAIKTSTARNESWANRRYKKEDLWAFSPLQSYDLPGRFAKNNHPIDAFIEKELDDLGISPAPSADKLTLLRRASYDLRGLPPSPEEVKEFLSDDKADAFERLIDTFLSSPQYGEQWARHWLDVVRYADSDGFSNDYARPNAWRYRDYVIRAFNEDKAYDEFVREQVAGDEIDPTDSEKLVASGFLRMGPWEHTGMSVAAETRQYYLDDVTNSVGESFLSLPLRCARCHDHKFDPIPTKDFYRIQAAFASTQFAQRPAPFLSTENLGRMEAEKSRILAWLEETQLESKALQEKEEAAVKKWFAKKGKPYLSKKKRRKLPDHLQPPRYLGLTDDDLGYRKLLQKRSQLLNREKSGFEPLAFSVYNGPGRITHSARDMKIPEKIQSPVDSTFILTYGSVYTREEQVSPGILSVVSALDTNSYSPTDTLVASSMEKRRLSFAKWLTHPKNPLTSRSIVNRIWQYHFGKGLAENSNNFGITGKRPTHPELLDYLAVRFIKEGWSMKKLHTFIMTSKAYQRSGQHPNPKLLSKKDPDNQYLAIYSPRRLEAEEIRDAMLFVSGELNLEMGGIPIRPEINREVALQPRHTMGSVAPAYQPSPRPEDRNRRSIYALKLRNLPDPMLEVFNHPGSELSCERRVSSSVSPQAFSLLNSQNSRDRSIALAARMRKAGDSLEEQIKFGMKRVWNRLPETQELKKAIAYVEKMRTYHTENPIEPETYPTEIKREMFEEMTGAPFSYTERLDVYENYTSDLKPWGVDTETRALADLALVLFNSNEFIYVY